ncbi:MAG: hypothetical protein IJ716_14565 [Lachnospiraceae bacterium]|nr:hypothetical protein [Lachnospiraceae bacterium]
MGKFKDFIAQNRSYAQWARKEIIEAVRNNPDIPASEIIERFAGRMDRYSCMDSKTSLIFSIAHDVALDMLDELIAKGARK